MPVPISTETLWIDTPKGRLFCCRWFPGGGMVESPKPPIVLFHDSLGCIELWRDFPRKLSQITGREVIAYDRLGFGQSDVYSGLLCCMRLLDSWFKPVVADEERRLRSA